MRIGRVILVSLTAVGLCGVCAGEPVKLTVHTDTVVDEVSEGIYGHFLEHIYHSVNGGLWGELIWNRSFEQNDMGQWSVEGESILQGSLGTNIRLTFGDVGWKDYEYTLEARKTGGREGFLILFRVAGEEDFYWCNLGGWGNSRHAIERGNKGRGRWGTVGPSSRGRIADDRWYRIRVRCEGAKFNVWLYDEMIIDFTDGANAHPTGCVGIGTWATQAEFRKLKVISLDGKVLYEGIPTDLTDRNTATSWEPYGQVKAYLDSDNPLNSRVCQRIVIGGEGGGIRQTGLCTESGQIYAGSVWVRGEADDGMFVRLIGDGGQEAEVSIGRPSSQWREYEFALKPGWSCSNASIVVGARSKGEVWIDQVSMMPESWAEAGGFRPDLLKAVADLKPPVIRWPGGCFASSYQWKNGIGPQKERRPHPREIWDDLDVYSFGTDEFVAMCRQVGAEPLIVVNIGSRNWNADADTHDYTQDILNWIEYCNGPAASKWGQVRAANGHREPYNVKYWEIDNETWHMPAQEYAAAVLRLAPLMKKVDPSIKLLACGSGGLSRRSANGMPYNRTVVDRCSAVLDYISIHHYENPDRFLEGPRDFEAFFRELGRIIESSSNPNLKIYVSEWNAQSTDWRTGLYCGGLLNAFERCSDILTLAGPALFLRHVSASAWDNAFINFDGKRWFAAPNYVVMKLHRDHFASELLSVTGQAGGLNVNAGKSEDGERIILKLVNPTGEAIEANFELEGSFEAGEARLLLVAPGSVRARNSLDQPDAVKAKERSAQVKSGAVRISLPRWSVGVVEIRE